MRQDFVLQSAFAHVVLECGKRMLTCPVCRSRSVRRSARRNFMERLWSFGGRFPYRCYECQTRFYAFKVSHDEAEKTARSREQQHEEDED
jgi:hypothetical protein